MFKKLLVLIILVNFMLFIPLISLAAFTYSNSANHYSFSLPDGWTEIPKTIIDQVVKEIARQTGAPSIDYTTGFQLIAKEYFQYPYVLVQQHDLNTPSYFELMEVFSGKEFAETIDRTSAEYSALLSKATMGTPKIDKERNILFMNTELDVVNIGKVKGLVAMFLGKYGVTQLNLYSVKSDYQSYLPVFNSIIDSFSYDSGYEYDELTAQESSMGKFFSTLLGKVSFGAIMGALVGLIVVVFLKFRKKSETRM